MHGMRSTSALLWAPKKIGVREPLLLSRSQSSHFWGPFDRVPRSQAMETPQRQWLYSPSAHLWATSDFVPRSQAFTPLPDTLSFPKSLVGNGFRSM